jgi:hypothetical protein
MDTPTDEIPRLIDRNGDEVHPFDEERGVYMAHCTAAGCGEYVDDWLALPPRDFLCDLCEASDD